ncbi:FKBP-type peptidyl-prolyl cis-trans isomerase [Dactylosporangium sp. NPDC051541]|uniref:FKBP-type peptidyl-prolyl cis-trans isomerase n=1 Tax=Dactylosporangium sp. NPDC051541 TaxID=3363977 RepID=UPI0037A6FAA6
MTVRPSAPTPLSKTEKRAAAKAAKEKARRAAKRRRILNIVGGVAAVVVVLAIAVVLLVRSIDGQAPDATSTADGTPTPTAAATADAPFPPLPAGADQALATKPEVKAGTGTVSALTKTTIIEGTGPVTQTGQTITVNYVGVTYADGKEFDASWKNKQAFTFQLGGQVIQGWNDGLVGVKVGTRIQLDIPANLAYGDNPSGGSPAGPLRFVVDVLGAQ